MKRGGEDCNKNKMLQKTTKTGKIFLSGLEDDKLIYMGGS
jgi:hypothetical protein